MSEGIAFLGSDWIARTCLDELVEHVPVCLVVSPPDRRRGRRGGTTPSPVRARAVELGLPDLATPDVNAPESLAILRDAAPRLLVVVSFGQYLRRDVRELAELGAINLHFSPLPRWRGASPVQQAILHGDAETGVAIQRVEAGLDTGPVLAFEPVEIGPDEHTSELQERLVARGAPLLRRTVVRLLAGDTVEEQPQDESLATHAPLVGKDDGFLDPASETADELARRVRAFSHWPGCRARLVRPDDSETSVRIQRVVARDGAATAAPGTVVAVTPDALSVACRSGVLDLVELQRPGGRAMGPRDFVNGWPVEPGARLLPPS